MREAVILTIRCLEPGCGAGPYDSSVGLDLTDAERLQTAESFVWAQLRRCREHHRAGVEARFSDDDRRIILSRPWSWRRFWRRSRVWA